MGEVRFEGATKVEKDSGVWVDGDYVGFPQGTARKQKSAAASGPA
jgi:hypothetical protein